MRYHRNSNLNRVPGNQTPAPQSVNYSGSNKVFIVIRTNKIRHMNEMYHTFGFTRVPKLDFLTLKKRILVQNVQYRSQFVCLFSCFAACWPDALRIQKEISFSHYEILLFSHVFLS